MARVALSALPTERIALRRLWWVGPLAVVGAVVANLLVRLIAGMMIEIPDTFGPLGYGPITFFTTIGVVGAVITFALLSRWSQRPIRVFRIVAAVVLVLSLVPDLWLLVSQVMPGATGLTVSLLMVLHIVAAAVSVGILTTLARD